VEIRRLIAVTPDTPLFDVLREFQTGRSHMALVSEHAAVLKERWRRSLLARSDPALGHGIGVLSPRTPATPLTAFGSGARPSRRAAVAPPLAEPGTPSVDVMRPTVAVVAERQQSPPPSAPPAPPLTAPGQPLPTVTRSASVSFFGSGSGSRRDAEDSETATATGTAIAPVAQTVFVEGRPISPLSYPGESDGGAAPVAPSASALAVSEPPVVIVGFITIEDVIEQLLQADIHDETDLARAQQQMRLQQRQRPRAGLALSSSLSRRRPAFEAYDPVSSLLPPSLPPAVCNGLRVCTRCRVPCVCACAGPTCAVVVVAESPRPEGR
jgi:hypothetical protein